MQCAAVSTRGCVRSSHPDTCRTRSTPSSDIPKTLNGKRMEVPVKRILSGASPAEAASEGAMANPGSLDFFVELARSAGTEAS